MSAVLFAFIILVGLGIILSFGLFYADKKLAEKKDKTLIELESVMPGANCGGCGFAGCSDYANAVFKGKAKPGLCAPGGQQVADKMGKILGVDVSKVEKKVAYVFCNSSCDSISKSFNYEGMHDCNAAVLLFNGENDCKTGCLRLLSCKQACNQDAIFINDYGQVEVDRNKCIGCGKCVSVCPHNVIKLIPVSQKYVVKCNSHLKGSDVNKVCKKGCIGCKICETKFPKSGITVDDNLAFISNSANESEILNASTVCPKKVIIKV